MKPDKDTREKPPYDLKERTFLFGVCTVKFAAKLPHNQISIELTRQLIRAATSVGANVEEADGAESRRDTAHKMGISRKEARETRYWLRMLIATDSVPQVHLAEVNGLVQEASEIVNILSAIIQKLLGGNVGI